MALWKQFFLVFPLTAHGLACKLVLKCVKQIPFARVRWRGHAGLTQGTLLMKGLLAQSSAPPVLLCAFPPCSPSPAGESSQVPVLSQGLPGALVEVPLLYRHRYCGADAFFVSEIPTTATFGEKNGFGVSLGHSSKVAVCSRIC